MWWHFNAQVKGLEHILRHGGWREKFFPAVPKTCNLSNFNMWKISLKNLDFFLYVVSVCNISMKYFFSHFNFLEICSCMNSRSLDTTLYAWPKVGSDRQNYICTLSANEAPKGKNQENSARGSCTFYVGVKKNFKNCWF